MKKSAFILIFLFLFSLANLFGQSMISGVITSKENGEKLVGVNIYINELQKSTISNSNGEYKFGNIPLGKYQIQFSFLGFKPEIVTVNVSENLFVQNVSLSRANINLGEVLVLGNSARAKEKIPYKVETVSKEKLENNGSINITNSLSLLPGISELTNGSGISKPVVRGLFGYRIAPIVNGLRIDNQQWQDEHDFGLTDLGAESIEIIEGPASLLFGSQALGGIIRINNEKNAPQNEIIGNYNLKIFSNTLGANTELGLKGTKDVLSWQFHLNGKSHADYLAGGSEKIPNTRFAEIGASTMLSYNPSWGISSLNYNFSRQINGIVEEADLTNIKDLEEEHFEREFEGPHHTVDFHIASLRNTILLNSSLIKLNLGFQNNHRIEDEGTENKSVETEENELDVILNTFSLDAQWIKPFSEKTELTLGAQGVLQNNQNDGKRILIPNAETNEISFFTYLKQNVGLVDLDAGLRYDIKNIHTEEMGIINTANYFKTIENDYKTINGALGASFTATENLIIKANIATGYRAPNLAELSSNGVHEGTTRYELGNENMKSEQSLQTDFGINFHNNDLNANVNLFYNHINNFIFLQPTNMFIDINRVYQFMQNDANLKGGEISIDWSLTNCFDLGGSYSTVIGQKSDDSYLPFMPADKIIGSIKYHLRELSSLKNFYILVTLRNYLKQNKVAEEELPTPAYTLVDLSLGSAVNIFDLDFDLAINATNLLDKKFFDHLSLLKPLGILNMGRNISLVLNVPFSL